MPDELELAIRSFPLVLTIALSAVIALVVVWILSQRQSHRNDTFQGDSKQKDDKLEMGYTGMIPALDVIGRRYAFTVAFIVAFLLLWFLCRGFNKPLKVSSRCDI